MWPVASVAGLVLAGVVFLGLLPPAGDASDRVDRFLLTHNGRRVTVPVDSRIIRSLVAVEDQRFYGHWGVDLQSVVRATIMWFDDDDHGGSTISQQLAKALYTGDGGFVTKVRQIGIGVKLERALTKEEILQMYANSIYYGHGFYGIYQAARGYFGKEPADLSWAEAALIAGLPQAPSLFDPYQFLERAKRRQRHVLNRLAATGALTKAEADAAFVARLGFQ